MTERVKFKNGEKVHYPHLNKIAKELVKLLLSSEKRISNPTNLSKEDCITTLQRFRDVYNKGRKDIFKKVELAEKEWGEYLKKIKETVPPPGSENVPLGLVGYKIKDSISLENVGIISDMIETDVGGFFFVSKTTPEKLLGALLFDERRISKGFRNIDMRIQDLINEWLPATLVLSGGLQHHGAFLGVYALDKVDTAKGTKVRTAHDREVWRHQRGDVCIAKISGGNWAVQKEADVGVNDDCYLRSRNANAALPHLKSAAWEEVSDGAWCAAAGLKCVGIEKQTNGLSETAVSAGQAAPASGGKRAEEGGAVGLKFAGIEQRTPMLSTTADSTSQGAAVSDGKRAQEGGEMSPTTGVAPSQQQSDNPTGHTSSTKLQEEPECLEHWYHEKAVRLGQVCLKVKKPREFLTELEGLHDGEFSKELLKDAGIVDEVRSLEEAHNDPDIKSRAKAVRRKWRNELKRKWEEEGEKGGKKIPVRED